MKPLENPPIRNGQHPQTRNAHRTTQQPNPRLIHARQPHNPRHNTRTIPGSNRTRTRPKTRTQRRPSNRHNATKQHNRNLHVRRKLHQHTRNNKTTQTTVNGLDNCYSFLRQTLNHQRHQLTHSQNPHKSGFPSLPK